MLNENQKKAIDVNNSVWISASAGTGKTKLLTDRVISLLLNKVDPKKILCITFTKAASAEMQSRINKELGDWVFLNNEKLEPRLIELGIVPTENNLNFARSLYFMLKESQFGVRIQTIHAFSQYILEKFPLEAGLKFGFKIIEDNEAKQILVKIKNRLQNFITEQSDIKPEYINAISNMLVNFSNSKFKDILQSLIDNAQKFRDLFAVNELNILVDNLYKNLDVTKEDSKQDISDNIDNILDKEMLKYISTNPANSDKECDINIINCIKSLPSSNNNLIVKHLINTFFTEKNEPRKRIFSSDVKNKYPAIADYLEKLQQHLILIEDKIRKIKIAKYNEEILYIAHLVTSEYKQYKQHHNLLDYNDLIDYTDYLLSKEEISPWVLFKLEGGLDHLLLDEAQDTSLPQWKIITRLTDEFFYNNYNKNKTILVVGDEKQSIYSFQGANSLLFSWMKKRLSDLANFNQVPFHEINLSTSFRSATGILEFVNQVFSKEKYAEAISNLGGFKPHIAFKKDHHSKVELWKLEKQEQVSEKQILANKIAEFIYQEINTNNKTAGDFLILVKNRNELVNLILSELIRKSIPVAGLDKIKLSKHLITQDLLSIGKFVLNPHDNFNLLTILRSPVLNISYEIIDYLKFNNAGSLWDAIIADQKHDYIFRKLKNFLNLYQEKSFYEFYYEIARDKSFLGDYARLFGEEIFEIIAEFLDLVYKYYYSKGGCLFNFIDYFSKLEIDIKREMENSHDSVRIMTIHGSKGLQAKHVILADSESEVQMKDMFFFDLKEKQSACYLHLNKNFEHDLLVDLKLQKKKELEDEYIRLLYVALTRAENYLTICGFRKETPKEKDNWYNICREHMAKLCKEPIFDENLGCHIWHYENNIESQKFSPHLNETAQEINLNEELKIKYAKQEDVNEVNIASEASLEDSNEHALLMGNVTHKLLQLLPKFGKDDLFNFSEKISSEFLDLDEHSKNLILDNIILILTDAKLNWLFTNSYSYEVPICGYIDKENTKFYSVRLDYMSKLENDVYILDFKTDIDIPHSLEDIQTKYKIQMDIYKKLMQKIYPDRQIKCGLLYVQKQKLFWLN